MNRYNKELLEPLVLASDSFSEVLRKLELRPAGSNHATLKREVIKYNIDYSHFSYKNKFKFNHIPNNKLSIDEILCVRDKQKSKLGRSTLLRAMKQNNILYVCNICNQLPLHNSQELILQIDHVDGNPWNNQLDNLRFLCPNCHSQTETYGIKNKGYIRHQYKKVKLKKTRINWPSNELLEKLLWEKPISYIAKELKICNSSVERRVKEQNINRPSSGYWGQHNRYKFSDADDLAANLNSLV